MAEGDGEKLALEQQLERAVSARLQHFKDQADSLTMESVRRLLEKDLGLEIFALDAHKRFIHRYLEKIMDGADDANSNPTTENVDKDVQLSKEEKKVSIKQEEAKSDPKNASNGNEQTMEDSPIMGVLTPKPAVDTQGSSLSESTIQKAILERADHIQANSDKISLAGVRRLLEEDLGLDKRTLDAFKDFISQQVDEVLEGPKNMKDVKKKRSENVKNKTPKKVNSDEGSDISQSGSDGLSDKVKSRKEAAPRRNIKKLEQPKKRKISNNADIDVSHKKQKTAKRQKEEDNNSDEDGSSSEDGKSQSSVERSSLRKEKSAPGYGRQVENLKSKIKACGMSVPPSIYKKVKQVPDGKRETFLMKELEGILSREGLSKNPTEKEIKDCRKRKDRAKELEGIDMSNIISSSRRRSTFSFVAPKKPEIRAKKDKVDSKDSKKKNNNEKDHNDDSKEEEEEKDKVEEEEEEEEKDKVEEEEKEKEKDKEDEEKEREKEDEEEEEEVVEEEEEDDEEEDEEDESEDFDEDDNEESD